ncbi:uncharacterized protein PHACADRAFT_204721, partial [Phanerochaete carnosa HHB-10118-sp]
MRKAPSTPPPDGQARPSNTETPSHKKSAQSASIFAGKTEDARRALTEELRHVPQVLLDNFLAHAMPPLPDVFGERNSAVRAVMKELQTTDPNGRAALERDGDEYTWASFPQQPKLSKAKLETEAVVFKQLEDIAQDISAAVGRHRWEKGTPRQRFAYTNSPHRTPDSQHRDDNKSRPDGYFLNLSERERGGRSDVSWWDIGPLGEFKKKDGQEETNDDAQKLLWGLNTIMREDPRRRAAYGFTIENTTTRLWYCDRTQIIASLQFDFFKEPESLVAFFLTVMYADEMSLGWDPTIVRVPPDECDPQIGCQYDITVHSRLDDGRIKEAVYRTEKLLSHMAADGIYGRGTRVWSACLQTTDGSKSPLVVIKDYWVDTDLQREGVINHSLRVA